ncbi:histidine acid phosphatase [Ophiocordyceps sinensis CO18]|uniref:3-phytase n=1 Tax=Ophiocordyceps sinensis (strain Co18 / CGMCC 3.14243) TaxID=911162 RepID=T5A5J9_OPHSC|nr:histidine acid phosphatase [Ophiocordyceps sinensis CO18]
MSTLEPRPPYSDAELAALYPPHLRLQLVQILLRHGERSPVRPRFVHAGVPPFWPYCSAVRHLRSAVLDPADAASGSSSFSTLEWKRRLETFGPIDDSPRQVLQGYYVRIRYNDAPVTVPGCRAPGKHLDGDESFCTLEAFKAIVDKFTPRDWKQQCRADVKSPGFPPRPEPAGY